MATIEVALRILSIWASLTIFPYACPPPQTPCSRITVPFTVRRPESEMRLQPDFNFKGPLINFPKHTQRHIQKISTRELTIFLTTQIPYYILNHYNREFWTDGTTTEWILVDIRIFYFSIITYLFTLYWVPELQFFHYWYGPENSSIKNASEFQI